MMYFCAFWCEFINLVGFFGSYRLTPVTFFIIRSREAAQKTVSIKHGLRTVDHGLQTGYKIRTRYKTRTTDYVYKNSFRR